MTVTEFLLARIAEDEADPYCAGIGEYWSCDRWSERRLAECEAKRRIVERYAYLSEHGDSGDARWVLPLLALPYADHPDYLPEWKP